MKKNIIKKTKPNVFQGLKSLTKWMVSRDQSPEDLERLIKKYGFDKMIIKRIISYAYNSPQTLWYIDKHMNSLYDWNKWEFKDILNSLIYIFKQNDILNSQKFFYVKASENKDANRQQIMKLLNECFTLQYDKQYSGRVIRFFYDLFLIGEISEKDLIDTDKALNNGKKTLKIKIDSDNKSYWDEKIELPKISVEDIKKSKKKKYSNEIQNFITTITEKKKTLASCKSCELFSAPMVVLDTNIETPGTVDVLFIGLNPGIEEVRMKEPFTKKGKSGKMIRDNIETFPEGTTWAITNCILCHTKNKSEISNCDKVSKNCENIVKEIIKVFPAKLYVPVGADAAKSFGIDERITTASGKLFNDNVIPVVHPSGMRSATSKTAAEKGWKSIHDKVEENLMKKIQKKSKLLFDIKEKNDGNILLIFVDGEGNKTYETIPYKLTAYIKDDNWKNCDIISDKVDKYFTYNKNQRWKIVDTLRDSLNSLK